jgi:steroid delta-isomerase-like uncharacterized protein
MHDLRGFVMPDAMAKVDIVKTHFAVENEHDMEAMLATLRDEEPVREEIAGKTYRGQKDVAKRYRDLWDAFPDFNVAPFAFTENDKTVVAQAIYTGTHKGTFNGFAPTGKAFRLPIVVVFNFDSPTSQKITSESIYLDYASQLRQLGLAKI